MKKIFLLLILMPFASDGQYRIAFKIANINSTAHFKGNTDEYKDDNPLTTPNSYKGFKIRDENTFDWPYAANDGFFNNIGRRFAIELSIERNLGHNLFLSTGFEIGARYFSVLEKTFRNNSEINDETYTQIIGRNYRNFSVPLTLAYNLKLNNRFSIKPLTGFSVNMPESFNFDDPGRKYFIKGFSPIYFMVVLGSEINYTFKKGNAIAINATYSIGFQNIIKDQFTDQRELKSKVYDIGQNTYYDYSYNFTTINSIYSNGTNLSLGIKYYFLPFGKGNNAKPNTKINTEKVNYNNRILNNSTTIKVDTNYVKFCAWDDQQIDGDSIAFEYKDSIIYNNIKLDGTKKCFWVKIEKNQPNYLVIHALNEGRVKPNSVKLAIYNKETEIPMLIKTDLTNSGLINLVFE